MIFSFLNSFAPKFRLHTTYNILVYLEPLPKETGPFIFVFASTGYIRVTWKELLCTQAFNETRSVLH